MIGFHSGQLYEQHVEALPWRFQSHSHAPKHCVQVANLALQLPFLKISESMGNHDSKSVGAGSVD
jgi:hypothetical protein